MSPDTAAAVLFADIAGSTALYESAGDTIAFDRVNKALQKLQEIAAAHSGQVIKTIGDEILCLFPPPDQAVLAASAMQTAMTQLAWDSVPLRIRIGIHCGPVVMADGDIFGDTVNVAARIVELANPAQILVTKATVDAISPYLKTACRQLYATQIRGKSEKIAVSEFIWQQDDGLTLLSSSNISYQEPTDTLFVAYQGQVIPFAADSPPLTIGRDKTNQLPIDLPTASRHHAKIFSWHGKFILADISSNGTIVTLDGGSVLKVHREELTLTGSGAIGLGCTPAEAGSRAISFDLKGTRPAKGG